MSNRKYFCLSGTFIWDLLMDMLFTSETNIRKSLLRVGNSRFRKDRNWCVHHSWTVKHQHADALASNEILVTKLRIRV